ncbi:MAG: substrate-binding domain-containing protein [Dysgonamonadaceae bacterium]|jgi:phosphate transport system substrate-binding protein|nr:substrate-binding domain-containing protein [Dysgonamonadaceae bacterium]
MAKQFIVGCLGLLMMLPFTSCKQEKKQGKWQDTTTTGMIPIACDECFLPIIKEEINVFESIYKSATILPIYTDEVESIDLLIKDSVRVAVVSRGLTENEKAIIKSKRMEVRERKIAVDAIALIVNRSNPDSLMGIPTLQKILTGDVTTWEQINPASKLGKIDVMFDNPNSSTVRYAIDSLCRGRKLSETLYAQKNNMDVVNMVSKLPNGLGIIGVNWVSNENDSTNMSFNDKIKVMYVSRYEHATLENSYQPYQAYIALDDYPMTRNVYILLSDPRSGLSTGFTSFVMSDRGQKIILKSGILPATQPVRIVSVKDEYPN